MIPGELLTDALNSRVPQIFDTVKDGDSERRVLNVVDTEAAKARVAACFASADAGSPSVFWPPLATPTMAGRSRRSWMV